MQIIKKFLYSTYFTVLVYLFTVLCWYLKLQTLAIFVSIIVGIFIILTNSNRVILVTIIFASVINYRDSTFEANKSLILIAFIIFAPVLLYDLFKQKINLKDEILISLLIFVIANLLSFINVDKGRFSFAIVGLISSVAFTFVYFYFNNTIKTNEQNYIAKSSMFLGLAIALEFFIYALNYEGPMAKDINLGWAISNHIAVVYLAIIPLTLFLYLRKLNFLYLISIIIQLLVVFLLFSKGAYLTIAILAIPLVYVSFRKVLDKKKLLKHILFSSFILIIFGLAVFILDKQRFLMYFSEMNSRGWFNDEYRIKNFTIGIQVFLKYPLFGAGSYTGGYYLIYPDMHLMNYHNIYIQSLATIGIFGFISFIYFIYRFLRRTIMVKNLYGIALSFSIFGLLIHGLVDTTWYNPIIFYIMAAYLSITSKGQSKYIENSNIVI